MPNTPQHIRRGRGRELRNEIVPESNAAVDLSAMGWSVVGIDLRSQVKMYACHHNLHLSLTPPLTLSAQTKDHRTESASFD